MIEISENEVEQLARILGGTSAAALALTNAEHRRAAGEVVRFFRAKNSIIAHGTPIEAMRSTQSGNNGSEDAS